MTDWSGNDGDMTRDSNLTQRFFKSSCNVVKAFYFQFGAILEIFMPGVLI